jgi:hypothetical protein
MPNPPRRKSLLSPEEMLAMRKNGATYKKISERAGIGPMRISQIVRRLDPTVKSGEKMNRKAIKEFVGADIDPAVKDALREHVSDTGSSISAFVAEAVEEKLKALGVAIVRTPVNRGEPLPFEE